MADKNPPTDPRAARNAKLAAALRANLRRRKGSVAASSQPGTKTSGDDRS